MADHPGTSPSKPSKEHQTSHTFNPKTRPAPKQPSKPKYT